MVPGTIIRTPMGRLSTHSTLYNNQIVLFLTKEAAFLAFWCPGDIVTINEILPLGRTPSDLNFQHRVYTPSGRFFDLSKPHKHYVAAFLPLSQIGGPLHIYTPPQRAKLDSDLVIPLLPSPTHSTLLSC